MKRSKFLAKSPQHGCGDTEHTAGELLGQAGELLTGTMPPRRVLFLGKKKKIFNRAAPELCNKPERTRLL
jgi:hypothetical protein